MWLGEVQERNGIDTVTALFSESQARVIVSVAREDDVKFRGLCEGRQVPVVRIGVTDQASNALDIADVATLSLDELHTLHESRLPEAFGPLVGGRV